MAPMEAVTLTARPLVAHQLRHAPLVDKVLVLVALFAFIGFFLWVMTKSAIALRELPRGKLKPARRHKKLVVIGVGALVLFEVGGFVVGYLVGSPPDRVLAGFVGVLMGGCAYVLACWAVGGFIFANGLKRVASIPDGTPTTSTRPPIPASVLISDP